MTKSANYFRLSAVASALLLTTSLSWANDDIEGRIESINAAQRSFVVNGQTIHATDATDYDDEYQRFSDLRVGHIVEVDVERRDGRLIATEVERDED